MKLTDAIEQYGQSLNQRDRMRNRTKVIRLGGERDTNLAWLGNTPLQEGAALEVWDADRRKWRRVTLHYQDGPLMACLVLVYQADPEHYLTANGARARLAVEVPPLPTGRPVFGQKASA